MNPEDPQESAPTVVVPQPLFRQGPPPTFRQKAAWLCLEIIAPLVWVYLITKLFIVDVDRFVLLQLAPHYVWLLNFRLFILLGAVAIFWLFFGNKNTLIWFLYIVFYPAVLLFWKIPWFIFKQKSWTLAFAVINSIISFFKSFKYNFIISALFLGSLAVSFAFVNRLALWISVAVLLAVVIVNFIRKFWAALKPSGLFGLHIKFFKGVRRLGKDSFVLDEGMRNLPVADLSEQQLQKRTEKLQIAVLFNRVCLFAAKKLKDYQNSGWQFVPSVLTVLGLIVFVAVAFTGVYYALFKLEPSLYGYTSTPTLFTFFYFSFNHIFFSGIPELTVVQPLAQAISMLQEFCTFVLGGIFVTLYISVRSEKYSAELEEVIQEIKEEGDSMEGFIRDEYQLTSITDALEELQRLKAGLVGFLLLISRNLE